jgi:uncharacterized membrane protein YtjA (UPF0391 family)
LLSGGQDIFGGMYIMLYYSLVFLVLAVVAGLLGFWGVAGTAGLIAKVLFALFVVGFAITMIANMTRRGGHSGA